MAKVLLVNPALAYCSWKADLSRPSPDSVFIRLGLAYLAGALKARGHETRLADLRTLSGWEEYAEIVKDFSPDYLGVSIHSVENAYAVEAAKIAKQVAPPVISVAGGIHPTMFPGECLQTGVFDYVIQGEGELSFPDLVENPSRFPDHFWGETPDLDLVPFPDREIWPDYRQRMHREPFGLEGFSFPLPMAEIINTRGCPYNCTFCCGPGEHQLYTRVNCNDKRIPYIRGRSVGSVIAEIETLMGKYGIKSAMFHDDQFIVSRRWVEEFVHELHKSGIVKSGFKWVTSSRADLICRNEDLVGRMAEAGLALLIIGFESFSPRILRWFNKGTKVDDNFRAAAICDRHGIKVWANYILGVRTDTGWHKEDDLLTVAGALKVRPVHFSPALYTPVPGSELFGFYKDNGLIDSSLSSVEDMSDRGKMVMKVKGVGYPFLESVMINDSVLSEMAGIEEVMKDYHPEMGDTAEEEYIRTKAVDAAASIIRVLHGRARKLGERCMSLQMGRATLQGPVQTVSMTPDDAMDRVLSSVMVLESFADQNAGESVKGRISVVIPVLNGGTKLGLLLEKLGRQKKLSGLEVIILDSGSTDGSLERARASGVKVVEVPGGKFSHGLTRQFGASMATGDYIFFTVQDAVPSSDYMLYKMVRVLQNNPEVMVVSARQITNGETDLHSRWTAEMTYLSFGLGKDMKYAMRYPELFDSLPCRNKRAVSFVDNVCACYRAEAIRKYGFAAVENAEDIEIGVRMIRSGDRLGFLHSTGVYHWHNMPADYFLKRSFIGVKSMVEILDHPLPPLGSLGVNSLGDVRLRCGNLYQAVQMSLDGMAGDAPLTQSDMLQFLSRMNGAMQGGADAHRTCPGGSPALEAILKAVGALDENGFDRSALRSNHLVVSFVEKVGSLAQYLVASAQPGVTSRSSFADAVHKTVAASAGELLGQWYMKLATEDRQSEMEPIRKMLLKGVCTG